jgi:putative flippase GtrA
MEKVLSQALSIGIVTIINFYVGKKIVFSRANSHNPTIVDSVPIVTDGE